MNRKWNKEKFIEASVEIHGSLFDYSKVKWKTITTKVEIVCPSHGSFWQSPDGHLSGRGCRSCRGTKISLAKRKEQDKFVQEANLVHSGKYSYNEIEYVGNHTKADITCTLHGNFKQTPAAHLSGQGCPKCSSKCNSLKLRGNTKGFIEKAKIVHGDTYDYSLVNYTLSKGKVDIICRKHGVFSQVASAHVGGKGCSNCAVTGYSTARSGNFYLISNGSLTKVGITNQNPSERLFHINNSSRLDFKLIEYFNFEDGSQALALETLMLKNLRASYEQCPTWFDGSSECFIDVPLDFISNNVGKFLLTL